MPPKKQTPRPLSPNEKQVLEFLEMYIGDRGTAPTFQEIKDHFGFASYNSVQRYLKQLQDKNYIHIPGGNQKRAISLLQSSSAFQESLGQMSRPKSVPTPIVSTQQHPTRHSSHGVASWSIPLLGRVAAGAPIEAFEHNEVIEAPSSYIRNPSKTYALRVHGQSMIEDGILDGDILFIERQDQAYNGDTVIAVIENEATVKRFYLHSNFDIKTLQEKDIHHFPQVNAQSAVELRPANSSMSSMWYPPDGVNIQGIVVGLIRRM